MGRSGAEPRRKGFTSELEFAGQADEAMTEGKCRKRRGGRRHRRSKSENPEMPQSKRPEKRKIETHRRENAAPTPPAPAAKRPKTSTGFFDKMRARLAGGHFRMLNEKLYTCTGEEALKYFNEDPSLFDMYHSGYQVQMSHWPEQPVNIIVEWLRGHSSSLTVADFGCGDARLEKSVKNKVFSLDLVSKDPSVIACDMSNTPLGSLSVDVAVFCLSLMGTNFPNFLQEAYRVLKPSGWLLIAEVKSRFDPINGGADPNKFSKAVCDLGFSLELKDFSNKMFILLYFKKKEKQKGRGREIEWPELKPCLYKRR